MMAMPTRYFCKRYNQELKPFGVNRGFRKFQSVDGKIHQCIWYMGKQIRHCSKLEVGIKQ